MKIKRNGTVSTLIQIAAFLVEGFPLNLPIWVAVLFLPFPADLVVFCTIVVVAVLLLASAKGGYFEEVD